MKKLRMDQTTTYQIKIPGLIHDMWSDRDLEITAIPNQIEDQYPATLLVGKFDQAALIGFLRQIYSLGLPIISVTWIPDRQDTD